MSEFLKNIFNNLDPEREKELDRMMEQHRKWMNEHPDYNERYGTDKSYWLQEIIDAGFKPLGITVMLCEETIIMETKEEIDKAFEQFQPEGWWYTREDFDKSRKGYVKKFYDGDEVKAPKVYWLK